jgi:4-amino-4-deoxy-L-arabinose transferase-like glycosyltransferase
MAKPDPAERVPCGEILRAGGAASAFVRVVEIPGGTAVRKDFSRSRALVRLTVGVLMARREARAYARLDGVAGVPRLLARPSADGLELDRLEGVPCAAALPAEMTQAFFDDLAALLARLRSRGVLHGDVKRNALVTPAGGAAIVDFGASFVVPAWAGPAGRHLVALAARYDERSIARLKARFAPALLTPTESALVDAPMPLERGVKVVERLLRRAGRLVGAPSLAPPRSPHPAPLYLFLLAATAVVLALTLGALPLTDPDEVFYAQTAREMLAAPSPLTPLLFGEPQFEKPPLTYWLVAASFALFGEHPWSARLVPAAFGVLGALLAFRFGRRFLPDGVAALGALLLLTSLAYFGQSIALLTDMVFTTLVAGAFFSFYLWHDRRRSADLHRFAALAALAVLTKGPVAIAILLPTAIVFLGLRRDAPALRAFLVHPWWLALLAVAGPWYLYAMLVHGPAFTREFLVHDNWHRILQAEHPGQDRWYFYPVVIAVGTLPWTGLFAFLGAGFRQHRALHLYLLSWIGTVYGIFALAHSKLASYVLPLFPALALLLAVSVAAGAASAPRRAAAAAISFLGGAGLLAGAFLAGPTVATEPVVATFRPVLVACGAWGVALIVVAALFQARRIAAAVAVNAVCMLGVVLVAARNIPPAMTQAFTGADLQAMVASRGLAGAPVVASPVSARGVLHYTGNPVVVVARSKHPFWSDHPLDVIASDAEIATYFAGRGTVLCVVPPADLERLSRLLGPTRTQEVLSLVYRRAVVLSRRR